MMAKFLFLILVVGFFGCNPASRQNIEIPNSDLKQAIVAFAELNQELQKEQGHLWNHKLDGPLLLINPDTRTVISNESDDEGFLKKQGDFYVGLFPENLNIANSTTNWLGKHWTMVALPLPDAKEERLSLLLHESFHRIQPLIGFDSIHETDCAHLNTELGRLYLKMELEALKATLSDTNFAEHLKNALLFRTYRYQLFPEAGEAENLQELKEGLAEYTGSILAYKGDLPIQSHYISRINGFYGNETFVRSFAYVTLPVYSYFMQKTNQGWNLDISKNSNLTDYMDDFFGLDTRIVDSQYIMQLGKLYHMDSIMEFENIRELNRVQLVKTYKSRFLGRETVSIGLENMHIGFNPGNIMPLDSFGTVYPNLRITDNWGILEVDSGGALVSPQWNQVIISAPLDINDTLISGMGWTLKLNQGWNLEEAGGKFQVRKKK